MSDAFYNSLASTASKLLSKFGGDVTISRTTGGSINPVTGAVTAGTTTVLEAKGLITDFKDELIDGTVIQYGDRLLVIDSSIVPVLTDRPVVSNQQWNIMKIMTKQPANVPIVYLLHVRR
jgi:hypothetical protein